MAENNGLRGAFDAQNALMESYALLNNEPSSTLADAMHSLDRDVKRIEALANDPTIPISMTKTLAAVAEDAAKVKEELGKTIDDDKVRFVDLSDKFVSAVRSAGNSENIIDINKEMLDLNLDIQRLSSLEEKLPTRDSQAFLTLEQNASDLVNGMFEVYDLGKQKETPSLAESVREGTLDTDLIRKVAHNVLDGDKSLSKFNKGVQAVANENVDTYLMDDDMVSRIVEPIAEQLDGELDGSLLESPDFCAEEVLGAAVAAAAEAHATADLDYFQDEFCERAVTGLDEISLGDVAKRTVEKSTEFSRAGVDVDQRFATGYVSIGEVVEAVGKLDDPDIDVESLSPSDYESIADGYAMGQQGVETDPYDLAADVAYNAELVAGEKDYGGEDRMGIDELMSAKTSEAELGNDSREDSFAEMARE